MNADVSCPVSLPVPSGRGRPNRIAIILLAVITSLLLALGAMGWWLLAGIDARYNRVLSETAESMNELHEVGLHAFTGYGTMMELRQLRDPEARESRLKTIAEQREANNRIYEKLDRTLTDSELRSLLQEVVANRMICRKQGTVLLAETPDVAATPASAERSAEFLHSCIAYQQSCDKLTDRIEAVSLQTSKELAGEIKRMRWLFLGVGVLPILGALIFLTITLGLLQVVKIDGEDEY